MIEDEYVLKNYERSVIDYFKEIALNTEYEHSPERVIKWKQPMHLYVYKEKDCEEQMQFIRNTVDELNELFSDGFRKSCLPMTQRVMRFYTCVKGRV